MLGAASIGGVPPLGLPKIRSLVGGILIPTLAASPLWSITTKRVIPFDWSIPLSLSTVLSTEWLLETSTIPFFLWAAESAAELGRTMDKSSGANCHRFMTYLLLVATSGKSILAYFTGK